VSLVRVFVLILVAFTATFAQGEGGQPGGPDFMSMLLMMGVILAIMYFLMIRPEQKKQKQRQALLSALKKGQQVVTTGGIHATVAGVKESSVMLRVSDNVTLEFTKAAVAKVLTDEAGQGDKEKSGKKS
jgi:preprotein translocase subunit YajC